MSTDRDLLVTVVGRGHSGTRAISHTLSQSGFYMGAELNPSGDLVPANKLYDACRILARHVTHLGGLRWDFSKLHTMKIDSEFEDLVGSYLESVLSSSERLRGWKLPETILIYPWIVRMFPDIHYIFWVRDPRDSILGSHITDDLADFGVPYDRTDDQYLRRAISWKYQAEIYRATPRPAKLLEVRFEDFVCKQRRTLRRLKRYLGVPLERIEVRKESVGRWKREEQKIEFPFIKKELAVYRYR